MPLEKKVSVIIPTYSRINTMARRAIQSALDQTHKNIEVILIGDGVVEEEANAAIKYIETLPEKNKIKFANLPFHRDLKWKSAGFAACNLGLDMATGDLIAPLDDDDQFLPIHLEEAISLMDENNGEFYSCRAYIKNDLGVSLGVFGSEDGFKNYPTNGHNGLILHSTVVYHAKFKNLYYDGSGRFCGDADLWNRIINQQKAKRIFNPNINVIRWVRPKVKHNDN